MAKGNIDWQNVLKQETLPKVIAFGGSEHTQINESLTALRKRILVAGLEVFNHHRVSARQSQADDYLVIANTLPVGASLRLLEVNDAEHIKEHDLVKIENYLKNTNRSSVVVFIFSALDLRQKIVKTLDSQAQLFRFDAPKEYQIPKIVIARARAMNLHIDEEAANRLASMVGTDLMLVDNFLEKLKLVCTKTIGVADIEQHIVSSFGGDAFSFVRAVIVQNQKDALRKLYRLKEAREAPLRIVGLLAWQLRTVIKARVLLDKGMSSSDVSKSLNLFGDNQKAVFKAADKSVEQLTAWLSRIAQLDMELKSKRADGWLLFEYALMQICYKRS